MLGPDGPDYRCTVDSKVFIARLLSGRVDTHKVSAFLIFTDRLKIRCALFERPLWPACNSLLDRM